MSAKSRHLARRNAVQALYQWDITAQSASDIESHFISGDDGVRMDLDYFRQLLQNITDSIDDVNALVEKYTRRSLAELNNVERAIMRVGIYELKYEVSIPYRSIINEAIELAKMFGADEGYKLVNAALDKASQELREHEQVIKK